MKGRTGALLWTIVVFVAFAFHQVAGAHPFKQNMMLVGEMLHPRQSHTATLLNDGRVLIVGWDSKIAELFDPSTGTFAATGSTVYNHRQGATATMLNDGKVLVVGGVNAQRIAEIYDPDTGLFTLTDSLKMVHCYHTATMLPGGKVLIAGGQDNAGPQTHAVVEIYDPVTGKFSLADSLNQHRSSHDAVLLPNGKVLIIGGLQTTIPGSGIYLKSCETYDPVAGSFVMAQDMAYPRIAPAILMDNGKVLVAGGTPLTNVCDTYDYVQQTWTLTGVMNVSKRSSHTATLLYDGRVLLAGGFISSVTSTVEAFNPLTGSFSSLDTLTSPRQQHCATRLQNGDILITGGYDGKTALTTAEVLKGAAPTAIGENEDRENAEWFMLLQNYPNPFNPSTVIRYQLPVDNHITIKVFDALAHEVATLVDEGKPAGVYTVQFDASAVASGVYVYRMRAGSFVDTKKLIVLR